MFASIYLHRFKDALKFVEYFQILTFCEDVLKFYEWALFKISFSTRRSQFEIEFGKNSKTYVCALKKNLSHRTGLAHFSYEHTKFFKGVS